VIILSSNVNESIQPRHGPNLHISFNLKKTIEIAIRIEMCVHYVFFFQEIILGCTSISNWNIAGTRDGSIP
jgi:hypothetical protein